MKLICLDGSGWKSREDLYAALLPELGAPAWHGHNLNALRDSLSGDINQLEPPFAIEVLAGQHLSPELTSFLIDVAHVFDEARHDFDVDVSLKVI